MKQFLTNCGGSVPIEFDTNVALAGYLALCIFITVLVHSFRIFDMRALASELDDDLQPLSFFERPDRGLLILTFGMVALVAAAYLGWRLPAEIQRVMEGGELLAFASDTATGPLARAAQVVGATCFLLVALRLMRLSLILTFAVTVMGLAVAAYTYVFG